MALSERGRTERYRQRMRAAGLRPVQIWVPDTTRPDFAERLRRQVELLKGQPEEQDALDFMEAIEEEEQPD
jgi:DNA-binding LacI/PurR family transcriptional regulator